MKVVNDGNVKRENRESSLDCVTKLLEDDIIEVDSIPRMANKPIVVLQVDQLIKLAAKLKKQAEPWLALKFSRRIYVLWRSQVFVFDPV